MTVTAPKHHHGPQKRARYHSLLVTIVIPPNRFLAAFLAGIILGIPRRGNPSTVIVCPSLAVPDALLIAVFVPHAGSIGLYVFICRASIGSIADTFIPPR